jgi:hypothetical protein
MDLLLLNHEPGDGSAGKMPRRRHDVHRWCCEQFQTFEIIIFNHLAQSRIIIGIESGSVIFGTTLRPLFGTFVKVRQTPELYLPEWRATNTRRFGARKTESHA